jgi:hypothetical protein
MPSATARRNAGRRFPGGTRHGQLDREGDVLVARAAPDVGGGGHGDRERVRQRRQGLAVGHGSRQPSLVDGSSGMETGTAVIGSWNGPR